MSIPDRKNANRIVGKSNRAGYVSDPKARHDKRLHHALADYGMARRELEMIGVTVTMKNHGHHWVFSNDDGSFAEWWPSSAKLVFDRKYNRGIHTHGSDQLVALIHDHLGV